MGDLINKGTTLKKARESKGISLQSVHEATKIPMDVLRAIEEGYSVRTLSPFYQKGFMKMYARYLGVQINAVVEDYQPEKLPPPIKAKITDIQQNKLDDFLTPKMKRIIVRILVALIAIFVLIKIGGCFIHRLAEKPKKMPKITTLKGSLKTSREAKLKEPSPLLSSKKNAVVEEMSEETPKEVTAPTSLSQSSEKKNKKISLAVRAKKSGWLQVKVDGSVVFQSFFKKGISETWTANDSIELSGKSIYDLELELNGKLIGTLGHKDRRATRVVVTREGLTVK